MTSGGYTRAEAWNLQLQGRVRDLEKTIREARRLCGFMTDEKIAEACRLLERSIDESRAAEVERSIAQIEAGDFDEVDISS